VVLALNIKLFFIVVPHRRIEWKWE